MVFFSMTRTDIHRPAGIIPANYCHMFSFAYPSSVEGFPVPGYNMEALRTARIEGHMAPIHKGGPCDTCGARFVEGSVFRHDQTGEYIAVGHTCADNLELAYDASEMKRQRKALRLTVMRRVQRRRTLREFAIHQVDSNLLRDLRTDHHIIQDIRRRIINMATKRPFHALISDKQADLVRKIAKEIRERADQVEEEKVPAPVSEKRQVVEGTIVSVKSHESQYGTSLKMTVKVTTDGGVWLCWGTCPDSITGMDLGDSGLKGCTVRFAAKLVAGGRDEHFAFFKRPTKAEVVGLGKAQVTYVEGVKAELAQIREEEGGDLTEWEKGRQDWVGRMEKLFPGGKS